MVGVQELNETLADQSSLLNEGVSETMQDVDAAFQNNENSTHVSGIEKHTSHDDTQRADHLTQQGLMKDSSVAATENLADMEVDEQSLKGIDHQGLTPQGVDDAIQSICQQTGDDKVDCSSQLAVSTTDEDAEKTTDRSAEGDGDQLLAGNGMQEEEYTEEINIREDELLKTINEVLEARHLLGTRPLPVLVKGKEVDLLKLCVQVRACGGYDKVTLWSSISKSLGFGNELGPLLKLVYVKYLKGLENRRLVASQGVQGLQNTLKSENEDTPVVKSESVKVQLKGCGVMSSRKRSNEEGPGIENPVIDNSVGLSAENSESLAGLLEWVKRLALNPGDPKRGQGARVSRCSEAWVGKCETLAGRVRAVLWRKGEHPLHDSPVPESQDQAHDRKKRGRSSTPSAVVKKSRH